MIAIKKQQKVFMKKSKNIEYEEKRLCWEKMPSGW
jgi:hypothetical protein